MAGEREVVQIQDFFFVGSHEKSAADLLAVRCREGCGLPKNSVVLVIFDLTFQGWKLLEVDLKKTISFILCRVPIIYNKYIVYIRYNIYMYIRYVIYIYIYVHMYMYTGIYLGSVYPTQDAFSWQVWWFILIYGTLGASKCWVAGHHGRHPAPPGMHKTPCKWWYIYNIYICVPYQLVNAGFLNHQQYLDLF